MGKETSYIKGFAFKSADYQRTGVRIVRVSDLAARHIKIDNENIYIDASRQSEFVKWKIRREEIVITTVGSRPELMESAVGRGILVVRDDEGFLNQNMLKLECLNGNASVFIFSQINTPRYTDYISQIKRGNANQANITVKDLMAFEIVLSTLPEQNKIADFLTAVDQRIRQLMQKKALLKEYKKGVMQQLFTQAIRFKDDVGNNFPDWEEKRLGTLCSTFKSGIGITSGAIENTGEFPVYGGNGLRGYTDRFTHEGNFVLIGRQGALCGNITRVCGKNFISEHAIVVAGNKLSATEWLAQRLDFFNLNRLSESSAQPGLAVSKLQRLKLMAPSFQEQTKIASFLVAIDQKIDSVTTQVTETQTFKRGLLQQMFV